jgi:hypothetical protein
MGLRLPGPRAARGSAVVNGRTWKKTCGDHVINRSKNPWLSPYVLGCIRFGNNEGVVAEITRRIEIEHAGNKVILRPRTAR